MLELVRAMRHIARGDERFRRRAFAHALPAYAEALGLLARPRLDLTTPWATAAVLGALRSHVRAALHVGDRHSAREMLERWRPFLTRAPAAEGAQLSTQRAELLELDRSLHAEAGAPPA